MSVAAGAGPRVSFARSGLSLNWDARFQSLLELAEACDVPVALVVSHRRVPQLRDRFESAQGFLARSPTVVPSCLILDVNLPDLSGLDIQRRITDAKLFDTDHIHNGLRRYSNVGPGNESGCR